jgi:uncharacterized protein
MVQGACQLEDPIDRPGTEAAVTVPRWHTRALVSLLLAVAATGSLLEPPLATPHKSALLDSYVPVLLVNLGLAAYVARVGLGSNRWRSLVGGDLKPRAWLGHAPWAAILTGLVLGCESLLAAIFGLPESIAAHALMPTSPAEKCCWAALAVIIGFSEELVYRGYLQQQLELTTGSAASGVLLQGMLFGLAHAEQGPWALGRFACYGVAFGVVAKHRRSIVPCILCHVALDTLAGLVG